MNKFLLALILLVGVGGVYYFVTMNAPEMGNESVTNEPSNTSAMRAEENMVVVMGQRPGTTVTGRVHLAAPGYLVIHENVGGEPGAILGASQLLQAGDTGGVSVVLSRAMREGETLHAMLHSEKGGNSTFSASEDMPVQSVLGGPISGWFEVSSDTVDAPISI